MNDSLNSQQPKAEPRWQGMSSLILGIITAIPVVCTLIHWLMLIISTRGSHVGPMVFTVESFTWVILGLWFRLGGWIFPAAGFVLGIMGLKYTEKRLAVTGIILSIVGFVNYTCLYLVLSRFG